MRDFNPCNSVGIFLFGKHKPTVSYLLWVIGSLPFPEKVKRSDPVSVGFLCYCLTLLSNLIGIWSIFASKCSFIQNHLLSTPHTMSLTSPLEGRGALCRVPLEKAMVRHYRLFCDRD